MQNVQFCSSSRKAKILTTGIYRIFRGLKFESDLSACIFTHRQAQKLGKRGRYAKVSCLDLSLLNVWIAEK
ncbi:MAG: hypothetical protein B1H13_06830 [Desulfobacteraceae bacterium 4484_190.3]|nr:MAG: hypothetical protein B1H13_06830 [Desulfobacteraceae bacterium 4484_190.3]